MFTQRVAVAALAIALFVAGGGFALSRLPGAGGVGPTPSPTPSASPSPSPSPSPTQSPTPSRTITAADVGAALQAGTYRVDGFAAPFTVTLPPGWTVSDYTPNSVGLANRSDGSLNVYLAVMEKVYPDPCHTEGGADVVGPGVDALVTAFSSMPDFAVTDVRDVTVGGASGKAFRIANSIDVEAAGCSGDKLSLGTYEKNGQDVDVEMFGGESDRFWVLDANGTRVFIAVTDTPPIVQAVQPVLDSLSFGDESTD